jgi:hypothetical protein
MMNNVVLELGGDIGALVLKAPASLLGREIEISPIGAPAEAHRTHSLVRERLTPVGVSYAAVYLTVPAGQYTVWRDADTPIGKVTVSGGEVASFRWPG